MNEPIKGFRAAAYPQGDITQFFGENRDLYEACCKMIGHNGIDIVRAYGTPILCVETGKVVEVKSDPAGYGEHIRILSTDNEWVYGHLSQINVALGQIMASGDVIGLMGNTGFVVSGSTPYWKYNPYAGTHLHLGRRPCHPFVQGTDTQWDLSYPTGDKAILTSDYNNGYFGSTDPLPEFPALPFSFTKNLYFGLLNDQDVKVLQLRLGVSPVTGNFGPKTFSAVTSFQNANNLPPTGFVGPLTRAVLNK